MEDSKPGLGLFFISISLLFFAGVLTFISIQQFSRIKPVIPEGSKIADIPVGGLMPEEAIERVKAVYNLPVELSYQGSLIHLDVPDSIDYDSLLKDLRAKTAAVYGANTFLRYLSGKISLDPFTLEIPFLPMPDSVRQIGRAHV